MNLTGYQCYAHAALGFGSFWISGCDLIIFRINSISSINWAASVKSGWVMISEVHVTELVIAPFVMLSLYVPEGVDIHCFTLSGATIFDGRPKKLIDNALW